MPTIQELRASQISALNKYSDDCENRSSRLRGMLQSSDRKVADLREMKRELKSFISLIKKNRQDVYEINSEIKSLGYEPMDENINELMNSDRSLYESISFSQDVVAEELDARLGMLGDDSYIDSVTLVDTTKAPLLYRVGDTGPALIIYGTKNNSRIGFDEILDSLRNAGFIEEDDAESATSVDDSSTSDDGTSGDGIGGDGDEEGSDGSSTSVDASIGRVAKIICILLTSGSKLCGPAAIFIDWLADKVKEKSEKGKCKGKVAKCICDCHAVYQCSTEAGETILDIEPDEECEEMKSQCIDNCNNPD